jgi:1-phosphofructokinase
MTIDGVASTVGAGDAMVAGLAASLADGLGLEALARRATAFAVGKLGMMGPIFRAGRGTCVGAGGFDLHADHGLTHSYWDEGRMRKLFAVIDAGGRDVQALLAAEALRKAARTEGRLLEVACAASVRRWI